MNPLLRRSSTKLSLSEPLNFLRISLDCAKENCVNSNFSDVGLLGSSKNVTMTLIGSINRYFILQNQLTILINSFNS